MCNGRAEKTGSLRGSHVDTRQCRGHGSDLASYSVQGRLELVDRGAQLLEAVMIKEI